MDKDHNVALDQDGYIATLRHTTSPELSGAAAEKEATKTVTDMFVSLQEQLPMLVSHRLGSKYMLLHFRGSNSPLTLTSDASMPSRGSCSASPRSSSSKP